MLTRRISTSGNSAALVLSQDLLGLMGVSVGDEVELKLVDRSLLVRPIDEDDRERRVKRAMADVIGRRKRLMGRLAEGAGVEKPARRK
jgi:antitoxin component of MazEF toxin-antitoxin module